MQKWKREVVVDFLLIHETFFFKENERQASDALSMMQSESQQLIILSLPHFSDIRTNNKSFVNPSGFFPIHINGIKNIALPSLTVKLPVCVILKSVDVCKKGK